MLLCFSARLDPHLLEVSTNGPDLAVSSPVLRKHPEAQWQFGPAEGLHVRV